MKSCESTAECCFTTYCATLRFHTLYKTSLHTGYYLLQTKNTQKDFLVFFYEIKTKVTQAHKLKFKYNDIYLYF